MDAKELIRYADFTKTRLREMIDDNSSLFDQPFETLSTFKSIRALVAHMAGAEERWQMRLLGKPQPGVRFEDRAGSTVAEVFDGWSAIRDVTRAFVDAADDDLLATSIHVSLPHAGFDSHLTFDQILYHVVNHQTYHAGQVTTTLQRWGVDPPNLDSIFVS
jgi:uncharacterized damage-inducible protein DinB